MRRVCPALGPGSTSRSASSTWCHSLVVLDPAALCPKDDAVFGGPRTASPGSSCPLLALDQRGVVVRDAEGGVRVPGQGMPRRWRCSSFGYFGRCLLRRLPPLHPQGFGSTARDDFSLVMTYKQLKLTDDLLFLQGYSVALVFSSNNFHPLPVKIEFATYNHL